MEGVIGPCLFESCGGGIHGLSSSGEGTGGQHLNLLGVVDLGACVDHFLSGFQEFSSELSELKDFSFDEWVSQSSNCVVNELLVWLSMLEDVLSKRMERGLSAISRSSSQFDGKDGMSLSHGEESPGACVVQYELHVLGFTLIVISITYGRLLRYHARTAAMFFSIISCFTNSSLRHLPSPRMTPVDDM